MTDRQWLDLTSSLTAEEDGDVRAEAAEVLIAESARCRLVDRTGPATVHLHGGRAVTGRLVAAGIDGWLALAGASDLGPDAGEEIRRLVNVAAVTGIDGSVPGLRPEGGTVPTTLGAWLREAWATGACLHVELAAGAQIVGEPVFVGADHVELRAGAGRMVIPTAAVTVWEAYR